ncbi:MAG: tetratricopeptide repeat protein [Fimbriimonadaceae bacterium]
MNIPALLKAKRFEAVAEALKGKTNSKSRFQRAYALCYLQAEDDAAALVRDLPFDGEAAAVHSLLARYYASRMDLTSRLGLADLDGAQAAEHYRAHQDFRPANRLSAVMIVKNEAAHIERCLQSIASVADEIVIVDTGSTDGTPDIISGLGLNVKLGAFEWCDDFAAARNAALELATGDWALWIDADEVLEENGCGEIRQALIRPHFGGFYLRIINYTGDGPDTSTYTHSAMRLFQRLPGVRFEGRVHEQVIDTLRSRDLPNGNLGSASLLHYGYRPSEMEAKGKHERFLTMLEREVREKPQDAFQWFNLANAYTVCGRLAEAAHAGRHAVKLSDDKAPYLALAYQLLANALTHTGKPDAALAALDEAEGRGLGGLFTEFERANALMLTGKLHPALAAIDRSMSYGWEQHQLGDYTLFEFKRHVLRGQILALLGRHREAVDMFDYALTKQASFANAIYLKGATLASMGEHEAASACFEQIIDDPALAALALTGWGRALSALGRYSEAAAAFERGWQLSPDSYEAWAAWAEACEASNDLDIVVRAYSAFAQKNEPTPEILINWGRALDRAGQPQRALDCFSEALRRAPHDPNAFFNCGDILYRSGQFQDAAHLFEGGLRLKPDYAPAWSVLGNCLLQLGLVDGARIAYTEALRLDPTLTDAAHNLRTLDEPMAA